MPEPQRTPVWEAPHASAPVLAAVRVPGSKSMTNRALVVAALASSPSTLLAPLRSRDTELMAAALRALGIRIEAHADDRWTVEPAQPSGPAEVDCGLAGTVMRFVPPVAALASGEVRFDGDPRARQRPLTPVLDALRGLGVAVTGDALPFSLHGHGGVPGGTVGIDSSASSQFVSGLLLAGARFERGLSIRHTGAPVPSQPHLDMTVRMLRRAGAAVHVERDGAGHQTGWSVAPGPLSGGEWPIEPDLSNAAPFLAAAAVTGGAVTVGGWPAGTEQAGDVMRSILAEMGCDVTCSRDELTVRGPERLAGIDIDLGQVGELTPTVAALAALAGSSSRLRGIAHLRGHETDRLAALVAEINGLGGDANETADGIEIRPVPLHGGVWHAYADHRMATAGAILGLAVPAVSVDDIACTGKTLPGFTGMWQDMLSGARSGAGI